MASVVTPKSQPQRIVIEKGFVEENEVTPRVVYVQKVNGKKTLDLYSGEDPGYKYRVPLSELPSDVCDCISLERLWVSHNVLDSLPPTLSNLVHLRELFLHHNKLKEIPLSICKLQCLELLWLGHNDIVRIPFEIRNMSSLKRLHLDNNKIEEFPNFLCEMEALEILYLNNNRIDAISPNVMKMVQLCRLYLHNNSIREIPSELIQLMMRSNLTSVTLDNNKINTLPPNYHSIFEKPDRCITIADNPVVVVRLSNSGQHPSMNETRRRYSEIHRPNTVSSTLAPPSGRPDRLSH